MPQTEWSLKVIHARFYLTPAGSNLVRDWLMSLGRDDRVAIGTDIAKVEFGWPIGMPTCRPMGGGLFEVRTQVAGNRIARVLFATAEGDLVLLHGFIKRTSKTPDAELRLARARKKEIEQ